MYKPVYISINNFLLIGHLIWPGWASEFVSAGSRFKVLLFVTYSNIQDTILTLPAESSLCHPSVLENVVDLVTKKTKP